MKLKNLAGMILVGAVLTGGSAVLAADNQADWTTTLSVKLQLLEKLGTDSLHVDVDTVAGDLTLTGTVNKRETRELAETIAKSVPSVKGVKNDILLAASEANPSKTSVAAGETEAERRAQREHDRALGLVPFAVKLPHDLVRQMQAQAQSSGARLDDLVAEWLRKGLAG